METKLTLRVDGEVLKRGKSWARRRRKSLSRVVSDYLDWLSRSESPGEKLPPKTARLLGMLKGSDASVEDYRRHLEEKHE